MTPPIGAGTAEAQHQTLDGPGDEDIGPQDLYQEDAGDGEADGMDRPPGQPMSGEYHQQHQAAAEQMAQTCPVHAGGFDISRRHVEQHRGAPVEEPVGDVDAPVDVTSTTPPRAA